MSDKREPLANLSSEGVYWKDVRAQEINVKLENGTWEWTKDAPGSQEVDSGHEATAGMETESWSF